MPGNNFAGEQVDYDAKVEPFAARLDICKIACPYKIWSLLVKLLVQMIGTVTVIGMVAVSTRLVGGHSR